MSEMLETQELPTYQLRTRDIVVGIWISFLLLLSIDSVIFQWLPSMVSGARHPLILFILMFPSISSFRITRIPEFLVIFISLLLVTIQLISAYITRDTPFIPPEIYDDTAHKIIANMIFISMILPWLWFAYRRFENKILQRLLLMSSAIVYPLAMFAQLNHSRAEFFYFSAIAFMSLWLIIALTQTKVLYPSQRNRIANNLITVAFLFLGLSFFVLALDRNPTTLALARLGMDAWIYIMYIIIALFSEGMILSKTQTLSAVHTYNQVKSREVDECIVFANLDIYLRNVPEDLIRLVDDDELTLAWIGLQRTKS